MENKLIIVEGLTGSGKSILAHFLARQIGYQDIAVDWLHEGEIDHPLSVELDNDLERFMSQTCLRWETLVDSIHTSGQALVFEACFLNNLVETLMIENVDKARIFQFVRTLQGTISSLNPALMYLSQRDTASAMRRNFQNRGPKFEQFVIDFATGTPYAQTRGYQGYAGMIQFWEDFVKLTDEFYDQFPFQKINLDVSTGAWETIYQQALDFLHMPFTSEHRISPEEAKTFAGFYTDTAGGRQFEVTACHGDLFINIFHTVNTRLIPKTETIFWTEGWHFEIEFEKQRSGELKMNIIGEDIDYLKLVGTTAVKCNP